MGARGHQWPAHETAGGLKPNRCADDPTALRMTSGERGKERARFRPRRLVRQSGRRLLDAALHLLGHSDEQTCETGEKDT